MIITEIFRMFGTLFLKDEEFDKDLDKAERKSKKTADEIDDTFSRVGKGLMGFGKTFSNEVDEMAGSYVDANGRIRDANGRFIAGAKKAESSIFGLTGKVNLLGGRAVFMGTALINAFAGATAAAAPLVAGAVALGASFMAAGVGMAAFGAVAIPTLSNIFEKQKGIEEAQKKINEASTEKEKAAAIKELEAAYAGLTEEQLRGVKAVGDFKDFWGDFTKSFEPQVINIFIATLTPLAGILEMLRPTIDGTARAIHSLLGSFNENLNTGPVESFFQFLGDTAYERTRAFGFMFGNIMRGVMALMQAFDPLAASMENGMVGMTRSFAKWAESLAGSKQFEVFINYVKTNGPVLLGIVGSIINVLTQLIPVVAPLGAMLMQGLGQALQMITPVILNLAQTIVPMLMQSFQQSFPIIMQVVQAVLPIITNLINQLLPVIMEVAQLAIPLILQAVQMVFPVVMQIIQSVIPVIIELVKLAAVIFKTILIPAIQDLLPIVQAVLPVIQRIIQVAMTVIGNIVKAISAALQGDWKGAWNAMKAAGESILNAILSSIRSVFNSIKEAIMTPIRAAVSFVGEQIAKLKGFFTNLVLKIPDIKLPSMPKFKLTMETVEVMGKSISYPTGFDVKWAAEGALVKPGMPTLVGVGDAQGYDEAILPLRQDTFERIGAAVAKTLTGGGVNYNTTIHAVAQNPNEIAKAVATEFKRLEVLYGR